MRDVGKQALAAARPLGEQPLIAAATATVALACAVGGDIADGSHADKTARLVDALSDSERIAPRCALMPRLGRSSFSSATRTPVATASAPSRWRAPPAKASSDHR
jgi:hypothetical protein